MTGHRGSVRPRCKPGRTPHCLSQPPNQDREFRTVKQDAYLQDSDVARFLEWVEPLAAGRRGIHIRWNSRGRPFQCTTLEQAHLRYNWPGRVVRGDGSTETIPTFEETARVFDHWRRTMAAITARGASKPDDHELFILTARRIRE